jgi:hypothetical protein
MSTETHITAGPQAAGVARLRASSPAVCASADAVPYAPAHQASVAHSGHPTTWIKGAFTEQATFMVLGKNRPTRPLSELSP